MSNKTKKTIKKTSLFSIIFSLTICAVIVVFSFLSISLFPPKVNVQEVKAAGETVIYRSVGPFAVGSLAVGTSNSVSFSGSIATFTVALPDNIGVGDVIQYDSTGADGVDSIAFIHGRTSSTVYTIRNVAGGIVGNLAGDTDWSIFRAYISLANAESGIENTGIDDIVENFDTWSDGKNITTSNEQWNIACYANGSTADETAVSIDGWTTDVDSYIKIFTPVLTSEVGVNQRHDGKWKEDGAYRLETTIYSLKIYEDYVKFDGLQIKNTVTSGSASNTFIIYSLAAGANRIDISNNLIVGVYSGDATGHGIMSYPNNNTYIYNNIIYGFNGSASQGGIYSYGTTYAYNNTVYSCGRGINRDSGAAIIAKNNIAYNNIIDFYGTFDALSTNNLSKDTTAPAYGTYYRSKTLTFTNAGTGTEDFHLISGDTDAIYKGVDLSTDPDGYLSFTTDIDGDTRLGTWDIGADESPDTTPPVRSAGSPTGEFIAGTTSKVISLTTDEIATCKYSTTADIAYASIANTFSTTTDTTSHSTTVTGLEDDTSYNYYVRCSDEASNPNTDDYTISFSIAAPDLTAPTVPTNLSATVVSDVRIDLSWTVSTDAVGVTGYNIYRCAGASCTPVLLTTSSTNSYSNTGLTFETAYTYTVSAYDASNNESAQTSGVEATTPADNTINAESCSQAHVQAAVDSVVTGDTVVVPAGSCTWSSSVTVGKAITINGNGVTLNANAVLATGFFYVTNFTDATNLMRITGFVFANDVANFEVSDQGVRVFDSISLGNLRIDHNTFHFGYESIYVGGSFGVIDNNYFYNGRKMISFSAGSVSQANASWESMDTGSADALFIEDNHFLYNENYPETYSQENIGTHNGGKLVVRDNTFDATNMAVGYGTLTTDPFMSHGSAAGGVALGYWQIGTGARRGQSVVEFYNNTISGKRIDFPFKARGSANLVYNNTVTTTVTPGAGIAYLAEEEYVTPSTNWDPVRVNWPAEDQVHNTFIWNNRRNGVTTNVTTIIGISQLAEDRDYFLHAPCSASDLTDAYGNTCTHGKATFTGANGASDTYPTDGDTYPTLGTMEFTSTGDNAYYGYTPYSYPHPLRDTGASPTFTTNTGTDAGPVSTDTINITATDDNGLDTSSLEYGYSIDNTCNASDTYGNSFTNSTDFTISTSHTEYLCVKGTDTADNTGYQLVGQLNIETNAPTRSASSPSGTIASGTTNTTISLTTNENATCKYGTTADTAYASIANTFTTTGGTTHSQTITGLSNGNDYNYYARCVDTATNTNSDDYAISFSIDFASTSGGGLPPLTFNPPTPPTPTTDNPEGGFKVVIVGTGQYPVPTQGNTVTLKLYAGSDTTNMAISNNEDFENASIIPYQEEVLNYELGIMN